MLLIDRCQAKCTFHIHITLWLFVKRSYISYHIDKWGKIQIKREEGHTWSLLRRTVSVVLLPPGFAAFQNCFCAEYLFMGHSLNRQSEEKKKKKVDKV